MRHVAEKSESVHHSVALSALRRASLPLRGTLRSTKQKLSPPPPFSLPNTCKSPLPFPPLRHKAFSRQMSISDTGAGFRRPVASGKTSMAWPSVGVEIIYITYYHKRISWFWRGVSRTSYILWGDDLLFLKADI